MRKSTFITVAAVGGLLAAGACTKKDTAATDSAGTAAMADTGMGTAGTTGTTGTYSGTAATTPTMSDTAAGTMGNAGRDTLKGRSSGDTTTKK